MHRRRCVCLFLAFALALTLTSWAEAQINVITVDCTPFIPPNVTSFGPDNTMGMSLQQVDLGGQFNVTEVTPAQFRALTAAQLAAFDLIAINNNPFRLGDGCVLGAGNGLGFTWQGVIGVNRGGRVFLTSHDAARFKVIIPPGGAFFGIGAPGPGVEPFGADELIRQAALWAGGGLRTGLLIFNDSARFFTVQGVGWNNPELQLPPAWNIADSNQTGGMPMDGGYTDILAAFQPHPIYTGLSDARFGIDSVSSFAANVGDGSYHSIFATFNPTIFQPTEVVINAGIIDVGGFNAMFGIGAWLSPAGPDGTAISLIRDETNLVFVSSTKTDGNLGGVSGADQQCSALASLAGLAGTYRAWISDSTGGPSTTFFASTSPYARVDGTVIANNFTDLTDGTLLAPINVTETGGILPGPAGSNVWTGTDAFGVPRGGGALCNDWTMNSSFNRGAHGRVDRTDKTWSFSGAARCNAQRRIYCFQQPPPIVPPQPQKTVFVTSTLMDGNLGGRAGADATCNALAAASSVTGVYKAWLSDSAGSPNTTFFMNPAGYVRVDGILVANSYGDLTDGNLAAPINVTETGTLLAGPSGTKVWTATNAFGNGLGGARCSDWTSNSLALRGAQGRSSSTASTWSFSGASPCNQARRLYCVEQ